MRILIIAHGHPDFHPGGGEVFAYGLYRSFREKNQDAYFLACIYSLLWPKNQRDNLVTDKRDPRVSLLKIAKFRPFWNSQPDLSHLSEEFAGYLTTLNPNIVHFQHTFLIGVEALQVTRNTLPKSKILLTLHEYWSICHRDGQMVQTNAMQLCYKASPQRCIACFPNHTPVEFRLREIFIKAHLENVDRYLCPSQFLLKRYMEWGLAKEKLEYMENGHRLADAKKNNLGNTGFLGRDGQLTRIDLPVFVHLIAKHLKRLSSFKRKTHSRYRAFFARPSVYIAAAPNRFGFFGQFTPFKGIDLLLQAINILSGRKITRFSVDLYGTAALQAESFREPLMEKLERMGDVVTFHGPYDQKDTVKLMKTVDWIIIPSLWWENSPLTIEEAMISKRPVICSNIGGMKEKIKPDRDGLHFKVGDANDLADTMQKAMIGKKLWLRLRNSMRTAHTMQDCSDEHIELYRSIAHSQS